jgi:four helix bundle protein
MEDLEKNPTFFRFEDLRIYTKALEYINWVHHTVKLFPEDNNGLAERYSKSAEAIALNIAEGSSRNKSQFVYYLKMAKSAVRECVVFTAICKYQDYLTEDAIEDSRQHLMEMTKMIGALIGSLQKANPGLHDDND